MKKVKVNEDLCIGCGACKSVAPDDFILNASGLSEPKNSTVSDDNKDVITAMESCPTGAITIEDEENCDCENCKCENCDCYHEDK